ncbi:MAG TPA: hypothetical protein VKW08_17695 [Xanthobacteraceae bacterium]|nr:hypothetical protein [Xanthobacteraceae bacterium]
MNVGVALGSVTNVADFRPLPAVAAAPPSVPTDIPAPQAVAPSASIPAPRNDARKPDKPGAGTSNVVVIDPQTSTVVFRSVDPNSGLVIDQIPAQALLRQRAYVDAQAVQALVKGKDFSTAVLVAEQQVDTTT